MARGKRVAPPKEELEGFVPPELPEVVARVVPKVEPPAEPAEKWKPLMPGEVPAEMAVTMPPEMDRRPEGSPTIAASADAIEGMLAKQAARRLKRAVEEAEDPNRRRLLDAVREARAAMRSEGDD